MGKRIAANASVSLPDNPVWIEFPRSDGNSSSWPKNTSLVYAPDGSVNWMKEVGIDEGIALKWRKAVGHAIALDAGLPGVFHFFSRLSTFSERLAHYSGSGFTQRLACQLQDVHSL